MFVIFYMLNNEYLSVLLWRALFFLFFFFCPWINFRPGISLKSKTFYEPVDFLILSVHWRGFKYIDLPCSFHDNQENPSAKREYPRNNGMCCFRTTFLIVPNRVKHKEEF